VSDYVVKGIKNGVKITESRETLAKAKQFREKLRSDGFLANIYRKGVKLYSGKDF
jgi:hypothetical protein